MLTMMAPRLLAGLLVVFAATSATAATPVVADPARNTGEGCSLAEVSGRPGISYYDSENRDLRYVRGGDASATSWSAPRIIDSEGDVGSFSSLAVVDGRPAIAYYDRTNGNLKYVQSADPLGVAWYPPVVVDAVGDVGIRPSLAVVEGAPAIAYYNASGGDLKYVRADDPSGLFWQPPLTVDRPGNVGWRPSLAVIGGHPAVAYGDLDTGRIKYVRALDTLGDEWVEPVVATSPDHTGNVGTLMEIAGHPAMSVVLGTSPYSAAYIRASDPVGTSWQQPVLFFSTTTWMSISSMAIVDGVPGIAYDDGRLMFALAQDPVGESWRLPVPVDGISWARDVSLAVVGGMPAIAYQDLNSFQLTYVRSESSGFEGVHVVPNPLVFGSLLIDRSETRPIRVSNALQTTVTISSLEIVGGSGGFGVLGPPAPFQLAAAESIDLDVVFTPSTEGTVSAILRVATNHDDIGIIEVPLSGRGLLHPVLANCHLEQVSHSTGYADYYHHLTIDAAGRSVAFKRFDDLVPGENPDLGAEIFLWTQGLGMRQISNSPDLNGPSPPFLSGDGRFLFFASSVDLVPGANPDGSIEIFQYDIGPETLEQVTSFETGGAWPVGVSDDGSILFALSSTNLDGGDPVTPSELFRLDRTDGVWERLTNGLGSRGMSISAAGSGEAAALVASADLVPGSNPDLNAEVFLWRQGHGIEQITDTVDANQDRVDIDFRGRRIVFNSDADLDPGSNPEHYSQVFLWTEGGGFLQISRSDIYEHAFCVSISDAGDRVAFGASGDQGIGANSDLMTEVFLWEESASGLVQWTDQSRNADGFYCAMSGSGRHLAFDSNDDHTGDNPDRRYQLYLDGCTLFSDGFELGDTRRWEQH